MSRRDQEVFSTGIHLGKVFTFGTLFANDFVQTFFCFNDDVIAEILVPCLPLRTILKDEALPEQIDVLQIDAEGNDDHVIYQCGLSESRPSIIHFETKHLPSPRKDALETYLSEHGYRMSRVGNDCLAIRQHALAS